MQRLKWFVIGIALTSFSADYVSMKAGWRKMESVATLSIAAADKAQASNTACLIELSYDKSLIESWAEKRRLVTLAHTEILQTLDRAREGDSEAITTLGDLGYVLTKPGNRIVVAIPPARGKGIGGF